MKKIFILVLVLASLTSCKRANYFCYDQVIDAQGNITASTSGKKKMYFKNEADLMEYQHDKKKVCIKQ